MKTHTGEKPHKCAIYGQQRGRMDKSLDWHAEVSRSTRRQTVCKRNYLLQWSVSLLCKSSTVQKVMAFNTLLIISHGAHHMKLYQADALPGSVTGNKLQITHGFIVETELAV
ncbi:hypothetical protein BsWGS_26119 [Bradybaena similaris]